MPPNDQLRLLVVEDVPQVAQYIRNLLATQQQVKLLEIATDGAKALRLVTELRPDVVVVDALLQGRIKGLALVDRIAAEGLRLPVVVLTVPQQPVTVDLERGIHGVVTMPFSSFDLLTTLQTVRAAFATHEETAGSRVVTVFAPKGGVGKTTIAFNLAVAVGQLGRRTVLIDGNFQFGDLRALLRVPASAPSILDLPTDRIAESDFQDVLWRDPSGIDILLAPPRMEMAEMLTTRDLDKAISMLRRLYEVVLIDAPTALNDQTMTLLDLSDEILEVVTYDSTTIHNTVAMAETFRAIGYPPSKVRYVVNRADATGGIQPESLSEALGRVPEHGIVSDGPLVVRANNEGIPFVIAEPGAQISQDVAAIGRAVAGVQAPVAAKA